MNTVNPIDNAEIDELLDQYRPDRYASDDHNWRAPVIQAVTHRIPNHQARWVAAEHLVGQREGRATRAVNDVLRRVGRNQEWPLPNMLEGLLRKPLSIDGNRVCLEAASPEDLEAWAIAERRSAAQDFAARSDACDGAEWVAQTMRHKGWHLFGEGVEL